MQEEYVAACASQGFQVGPCGFAGKSCKHPQLAAMICSTCAVTNHELCAQANKECATREYADGCPTCHMRVPYACGTEWGEGVCMDFCRGSLG